MGRKRWRALRIRFDLAINRYQPTPLKGQLYSKVLLNPQVPSIRLLERAGGMAGRSCVLACSSMVERALRGRGMQVRALSRLPALSSNHLPDSLMRCGGEMPEQLFDPQPELKPCPFCGGEAALYQTGRDRLQIKCKTCLVQFVQRWMRYGPDWLAEKMAERWNTRINITFVNRGDAENWEYGPPL